MLGINATLIFVAISFIIFVYLLKLVFFDPIGEIKHQRRSELDSLLLGADTKQAESEELIAEINEKITAIQDKQAQELEIISEQAKKELTAQYETAQKELSSKSQEKIKQISETLDNSLNNVQTIAEPVAQVIYQRINS